MNLCLSYRRWCPPVKRRQTHNLLEPVGDREIARQQYRKAGFSRLHCDSYQTDLAKHALVKLRPVAVKKNDPVRNRMLVGVPNVLIAVKLRQQQPPRHEGEQKEHRAKTMRPSKHEEIRQSRDPLCT